MPRIHLHNNFAAQFCGTFQKDVIIDHTNFNGSNYDSEEDITIGDILAVFEAEMGLPFDHNCSITLLTPEPRPDKKMSCKDCSMLASLHAHTPENAAEFKFGCSGIRRQACRDLHSYRLQGPPGASGWTGNHHPTPEEIEAQKYRDLVANYQFEAKVAAARKIMEETQ